MPPMKGNMLNYSEEQMNSAIDMVFKGTPVATVAKHYPVPRVTLLYKVKGKTPRCRRMGPESVLKKEEEELLVQWIITVSKGWKKKVHEWRMGHLSQPVLKKSDFPNLVQETIAACITPSLLRNGFRKCGLVPWNPEAVDFSKLLTVVKNVPINPEKTTELKIGLAVLENHIQKDKLTSFRACSHECDGDVNDKSLFLLWKKHDEDCAKHCNLVIPTQQDTYNNVSQNRNTNIPENDDYNEEDVEG